MLIISSFEIIGFLDQFEASTKRFGLIPFSTKNSLTALALSKPQRLFFRSLIYKSQFPVSSTTNVGFSITICAK
jgi:hypothetical protein